MDRVTRSLFSSRIVPTLVPLISFALLVPVTLVGCGGAGNSESRTDVSTPPAPPTEASLKLYVFDCGRLTFDTQIHQEGATSGLTRQGLEVHRRGSRSGSKAASTASKPSATASNADARR